MKKVTFILILLLTFCLKAQNPSKDVIVKMNGDSINVNILSIDDKVSFNYPDEKIINYLSKNCINEIIFSSGRKESFSEKIIVNGVKDWEKVIITTNPDDVKCLVRIGEVSATSNNSFNFDNKMTVERKATEKFKKEAAKLKGHIILIEDQFKKGTTYWEGDVSSKYGIAYSYD